MKYKSVASISVICNNSDDARELLDSLKDKYIFVNIKNKDYENPMQLTSTYKIKDVIIGEKDEIGIVGDKDFISLPFDNVIELTKYGNVSVTEHRKSETLIKNYYIVA